MDKTAQEWGVTDIQAKPLRQVLGSYPTGVAIVTTRAPDGRLIGLTINSFAALSLDPALVLWSLGQGSPHVSSFLQAGQFAISVLSAEQQALAQRFATPGLPDKFEGVNWHTSPEGLPVFNDAAAALICETAQQMTAGDHWLFVGKVLRMVRQEAQPLVFHGGRFTALANSLEMI